MKELDGNLYIKNNLYYIEYTDSDDNEDKSIPLIKSQYKIVDERNLVIDDNVNFYIIKQYNYRSASYSKNYKEYWSSRCPKNHEAYQQRNVAVLIFKDEKKYTDNDMIEILTKFNNQLIKTNFDEQRIKEWYEKSKI